MKHKITLQQCLDAGFTNAAYIQPQEMECLYDIRKMCEVNRCGLYNQRWTCPPACGTLEELEKNIKSFSYGILLQVTGEMEDDYDYETICDTELKCKIAFSRLVKDIRSVCRKIMPLSAGGCELCEKCTYPDEPCRFSELAAPSLEACGLFVSKECQRAGIPYYYGQQTMTFSAAVLIDD